MNFLDSCRICRTHCTTSNSQYLTTSINDIEIREILTQTIPIDFNDEISQKLPQKICFGCFETFMSAYELQKKAIESDEIFRGILNSEENLVDIKTERLDTLDEIKIELEDYQVMTEAVQDVLKTKRNRKQNLKPLKDENYAI